MRAKFVRVTTHRWRSNAERVKLWFALLPRTECRCMRGSSWFLRCWYSSTTWKGALSDISHVSWRSYGGKIRPFSLVVFHFNISLLFSAVDVCVCGCSIWDYKLLLWFTSCAVGYQSSQMCIIWSSCIPHFLSSSFSLTVSRLIEKS